MKICSKCKEEKSFSEFNKSSGSKDGFFRNCKQCTRAYNNAYAAKRKKKDPEYRKGDALRQRNYRRREKTKRGLQPYKKVLCTSCNKMKENQFMYSKTTCGPCSREYARVYYLEDFKPKRETLIEWMNELKSKPCTDCGNVYPPVCMDWDHVVGKKSFEISTAVNQCRNRTMILEELEKCELVCSNCHRIRTHITRKSDDNTETQGE